MYVKSTIKKKKKMFTEVFSINPSQMHKQVVFVFLLILFSCMFNFSRHLFRTVISKILMPFLIYITYLRIRILVMYVMRMCKTSFSESFSVRYPSSTERNNIIEKRLKQKKKIKLIQTVLHLTYSKD